jgi:predicted heme/steroid binding protein
MRRRLAGIVVLACLLIACGAPALATEEYALETGKPCGACHRDPAGGGGGLIAQGTAFQAQRAGAPAPAPLGPGLRALRLAAGFLHLLTAILWFGTIFYVHLMLKPSYAARGLPRGEVRIGRASMAAMVVTGLVLTWLRVPSLDVLLHTRFGILLTVKVGLFLIMLATAMLAIHWLSPRLMEAARQAAAAGSAAGRRDLALAELDQYDGRDGRRAYIAYRGVVYDVTGGGSWQSGLHMGRHQAGSDLTRDIALAPHNDERVLEMPVVGRLLADRTPRPLSLPERIFYAAAYLNLALAVAIVLVVALWRWG